MTDRPIIFSAPMVRALLDGRKTQTRRLADAWQKGLPQSVEDGGFQRPSPWRAVKPGDRLWVRETHWRLGQWLHEGGRWHFEPTPDYGPVFHAPPRAKGTRFAGEHGWWQRPSIFHERQHSRLTLTVTDVRVQRLQEISEEDIAAEGVRRGYAGGPWGEEGLVEDFSDLWDSIHGPGAWDANPWVCALTFTVERWNIDARAA